jgi:non-specific serine/threonine protein kinase
MIGRDILHYHIVEKLGEGGMGAVYKARDSRLDRDVAIKFLPSRIAGDGVGRSRFEVEARAAAALNHPNIATIHAIEEVDGEMFIVMEYIQGHELKELIARGGLGVDRAVKIALDVAKGLQLAHQKGIIHRDIKSSNVMVTDGDTAKVTDFGLAKIGAGTDITKSGITIGTVAYMSPEQILGERVDHRSDIWSFGVLLYEMLTGKLPFAGDYERAISYAILNVDPKPVSELAGDVPAALDALVAEMLEKNASARPQSIGDVIAVLKRDDLGATPKRAVSNSDSDKQIKRPGLAVLPFTSIKRDPDVEYLGFALADQIIGALSYVNGVLVRPSSAIRKYQDQTVDAPTVGHELQVEYVLAGYYLIEGSVVRLNVELVKAHSNEMVWRESIQADYNTVFALQDIAAEKVLGGLKVRFSSDERQHMRADVPADPLAYEYYLRAVSYPVTLDGDRLAVEMLEKALDLDQDYAPGWAELGYRISQLGSFGLLGEKEQQRAENALKKALSLNGNLLAALFNLSVLSVDTGRLEEALDLIDRMLRITPDNATAHFALSYVYRYAGMLEESVNEVETALMLDPKNPRFRSGGFTFLYRGDYRKAYELFDLDGASTLGIAWKGMSLFLMGENERALEFLDRAVAMEPEGFLGLRHGGIGAYIRGDVEKGLRLIRRLDEATDPHADSEHWYLIAGAYSLLGDRASCVRALRRAIDLGFFSYPAMQIDPQLDSVRDDQEFQEVLAIAKRKHEAFRKAHAGRNDNHRTLVDATDRRMPATAEPRGDRTPRGRAQTLDGDTVSVAKPPEVRYCTTEDGVAIAYSVHGSGPVLGRVIGWFTHLQMEWEWPALRLMWERLAERHTLVRYDGRGMGLSGRWDGAFTEETRQMDLDAVLKALGEPKVNLLGISEGGWTAAHYTAQHSERVHHLVIYGSYARGASLRPGFDAEEEAALLTLVRKGWGRDTPEIRQIFTTLYFGEDADPGLVAHFNALQRASADGDTSVRYQESLNLRGDGREAFSKIRVPTLVIHCRDDRIMNFEEGRIIASVVPGAKLLPFPTRTHYFPIDDELTRQMTDAIDRFTGRVVTT